MRFTIPTNQYWVESEKRLRENIAKLTQPPSFIETLVCVTKFLEYIESECGSNVKQLQYTEKRYMAVCMASKIIFDSPIMENLDIPHFLSYSYDTRRSTRI